MAVKITIHEKCPKCGARNAKVIGDIVKSGHHCPAAPPGPFVPPWREHRLENVILEPGDFDVTFLAQELREAWVLIEAFKAKRWRAEIAVKTAVEAAMSKVYRP